MIRPFQRKGAPENVQEHDLRTGHDVLPNADLPGMQDDRGVWPVLRTLRKELPLTRYFSHQSPREPEKPPVFICRDRKPRAETDP